MNAWRIRLTLVLVFVILLGNVPFGTPQLASPVIADAQNLAVAETSLANNSIPAEAQSGTRVSIPGGVISFRSSELPDLQSFVFQSSTLSDPPPGQLLRDYQPVGDAFVLNVLDQQGNPVPTFGVEYRDITLINYLGEEVTFSAPHSVVDTVIEYDESLLQAQGLTESTLALFSYDSQHGRWAKLLSNPDPERNQLQVVFHTLNSNIFRLGAYYRTAATPLVYLDPENNVGYVDIPSEYAAQEGWYNVQTALDIADQLSSCGSIEVAFTHTDPYYPSGVIAPRVQTIIAENPDVALSIGYDSHSRVMAYGDGGVKVLLLDVGQNNSLADRILQNMYGVYPHYHGPGKFPYPYTWGLPGSVELAVASQQPDIPIVRIEVGLLSLYQNRDWLESDFALPQAERQIPNALSQGLMEFLNEVTTCSCGDERLTNVENDNYNSTDAADNLNELIADDVSSDYGAVIESGDDRSNEVVLQVSPPLLIPTSDIANEPLSETYEGITVTPYITSDGEITFSLPVDLLYELSARLSVQGGITTYVPLSFTDSITDYENFFSVLSSTLGIGTCHGLMTWLARYCAGLEPLSWYSVSSLGELSPDNLRFMEAVLWYQAVQLTEEFYSKTRSLSPREMDAEMQLGLNRINAPRILTLVPSEESMSCDEGEVPTGHTLFVIGYNQSEHEILAIDPNFMEDTISIKLELDAGDGRWLYENAPYPTRNGSTWDGDEMYTLSPGAIPAFPRNGEEPDVHWLGLDSESETFIVNNIASGYGHRYASGVTLAVSGYGHRYASGTEQSACVPFSLAAANRPFLPGNLLLPATEQSLKLGGRIHNASAGMTFFHDRHATVIYGAADSSTVNRIGLGPEVDYITVTTNMPTQDWATTYYRSVDADRTNRVMSLRHTTLQAGEVLGTRVSPHDNLFGIDNTQGNDRDYDLTLATVGWGGYTKFLQDDIAITAGSVQTITVWNWNLLNVTPIFMYEDTDGDGDIDQSELLQDLLRPTSLHVGLPSYVSGTVTYLTPWSPISFDVMEATCGISATLYSLDGGPFEVYTRPFTLDGWADGWHTIDFYSVDGIGNVEPTNSQTLYLYSTPPSLRLEVHGDLGADGWYTPPVTVSLVVTPTVLPIDPEKTQSKINNAAWQVYTQPLTIATEHVNRVSGRTADLAGLSAPEETVFVPIRVSEGVSWNPGDPTMDPTHRQTAYSQIAEDALSYPGRVRWALDYGTCQGTPMQPGDFCQMPTPPLGIPAELSATWTVSSMLALQGENVVIFRSALTDTQVNWEAGSVVDVLSSYLALDEFTEVDEIALQEGQGLEGETFLILPSIPLTYTRAVTQLLGSTGLAYLSDFVHKGGTIYATGQSIPILESAGLVTDVLDLDNMVEIDGEIATLQVAQPDHPLALNWLTETTYAPSDHALRASPELETIAVYSDTNQPGTPAILYGQVGNGQLILVNHHPLVPRKPQWYPPFFDALWLGLSKPAALLAQAQQIYDPGVDYGLLPAGEAGVPISVTIALDILDDMELSHYVLTETIQAGFVVDAAENMGWQIYPQLDASILMVRDVTTPTSSQGRTASSIVVRTTQSALLAGEVTVTEGEAKLTALDGRTTYLKHAPTRVRALLPPETLWHKRVWPEILYGIPSKGVQLEVAVGAVNWHDTPAYAPAYTETIPLLAPVLDQSMNIPLNDHQDRTVWTRVDVVLHSEPLPDQARRKGQTFGWEDWDGQTVYTLTLPAGVDIQLPFELGDEGCDSPFSDISCCTNTGLYSRGIEIIRTPTQTLVVLPAIALNWHLDDLNGYEYQDPIIRYGLRLSEIRHRAVRFAVNYDPHDEETLSDPHIAFLEGNGSLWVALGHQPLSITGGPINTPISPHRLGASLHDLWSRAQTTSTPALRVHLVAPIPVEGNGRGASKLNVTSQMWADLDGDGLLNESLTDVPADRPVRACVYTAMQDWGRSRGDTGILVLRFPWGLGYRVQPDGDSWADAWQSENGYVVYSDTVRADGEDWVRFRVNLPDWTTERLTTCLQILPYEGIAHEGYRTFFEGALYYYPFDLGGNAIPIYQLATSYIQSAWAVAHTPSLEIRPIPRQVGRVGDILYHLVTFDDQYDPRPFHPYIYTATYGGGDWANTTYLGGSSEGQLHDPVLAPGDEAILRVEMANNGPQAWENLQLHLALPAGITAVPYDPPLSEPGALNERPHLNLSVIEPIGWGLYYFKIAIDADYSGEFGNVQIVPITASGDHLPADMTIPSVRLAVVKPGGQATDLLGKAVGLEVIDSFHSFFTPLETRLLTATQVLDLVNAWYTNPEAAAAYYGALAISPPTQIISDGTGITVYVFPPSPADELPAQGGPYTIAYYGQVAPLDENQDRLTLDLAPSLIFTDHFGYQNVFTGTGTWIEAGGPLLQTRYQLASARPSSFTTRVILQNFGDGVAQNTSLSLTLPLTLVVTSVDERCEMPIPSPDGQIIVCQMHDLIPYATDSITFTAQRNTRSALATEHCILVDMAQTHYLNGFTGRWERDLLDGVGSFVLGVEATNDGPTPLGNATNLAATSVEGCKVTYRWGFGDGTDGTGATVTHLYPTPGIYTATITASNAANELRATTIVTITGTEAPRHIYLPLVLRGHAQPVPDLVISNVQIDPPDPIQGEPAEILVTVTNVGDAPATPDFWVDLYLNPSVTPTVNLLWHDISDWGAAWLVHTDLAPGESIVLSSNYPNDPEDPGSVYSNWPGYFPVAGDVQLFFLADAYGLGLAGAVGELREDNNLVVLAIPVVPGTSNPTLPLPVELSPRP